MGAAHAPAWRTAAVALGVALVLALSALVAVLAVTQRGYAETSPEVGFARDMYVHHDQAVAMGLLVRERGSDPEVAQLARDIITGQAEEQGVMLGWLREQEVPATTRVAPMAWMDGAAGGASPGGSGHGSSAGHGAADGASTGASTGTGGHGSQGMGGMSAPTAAAAGAGPDVAGGPDGAAGAREAMGMATDDQLSELGRLSGTGADLLFVQLMQRHHLGALSMAAAFADLSDEPTLSRVSEGVLTTQQRELDILAGMRERLAAPAV